MRGKENRPAFILQAPDDLAHFHPSNGIQAAGRLIEDEQVWIVDQRLGQADALLHPLRVSLNWSLPRRLQLDQFEHGVDPPISLRPWQAEDARIETQQFLGTQKFVVVRQFGQVADSLARDRLADVGAKQKALPGGRIHKTEEHIHRGGLARAVGSEETEYLAGVDC